MDKIIKIALALLLFFVAFSLTACSSEEKTLVVPKDAKVLGANLKYTPIPDRLLYLISLDVSASGFGDLQGLWIQAIVESKDGKSDPPDPLLTMIINGKGDCKKALFTLDPGKYEITIAVVSISPERETKVLAIDQNKLDVNLPIF